MCNIYDNITRNLMKKSHFEIFKKKTKKWNISWNILPAKNVFFYITTYDPTQQNSFVELSRVGRSKLAFTGCRHDGHNKFIFAPRHRRLKTSLRCLVTRPMHTILLSDKLQFTRYVFQFFKACLNALFSYSIHTGDRQCDDAWNTCVKSCPNQATFSSM